MNKPLSIIDIVFSSIANLLLFPWTYGVLLEQVNGSVGTTNLGLGVLLPWIIQFMLLPFICFCIVISIVNIFKYNLQRTLQIIELISTAFVITQIVIFNILIFI